MPKIDIAEENRRRRRVNKLKKIILCTVIVCIVVPSALSIMLMIRVGMLERELKEYKEREVVITASVTKEPTNSSNTPTKEAEEVDLVEVNDVDQAAQEAEIATVDEEDEQITKEVYLTFDDGPSDNTDEILDILKRYQVKATFFVVARSDEESIRLYNRIVDEGHTLAMHSYTHVYSLIYENLDNFKQDVLGLQNFLYENTGIKPTIYRFPGGSSNTVMNVSIWDCISFLNDEGITYFDWNVSSGDATGKGYSVDEIVNNVIEGCDKHDKAVVLLHDASSKENTVEALPKIIEAFNAMGNVMILPLNEDSYPVQHTKWQ